MAVLRLQDVLSVALHLGCLRKLVLGDVPAPLPLGIVARLLVEGARDDGLGL